MHFEEFSFDDIDDNDLNNMLESGDVAKGTVPYQSFFNYIKAKIPTNYKQSTNVDFTNKLSTLVIYRSIIQT